jgi:tetratricopeptide (TPR) repeat protein
MIGDLLDRVTAYRLSEDPQPILDERALATVTRLADLAVDVRPDGTHVDAEALAVVVALHMARATALPASTRGQDLRWAIRFHGLLAGADVLPAQVRAVIERHAAQVPGYGYLHDDGYAILHDAGDDRAAVDEAIHMLQQAVEAAPAEEPERPTFLSHLATGHERRFDLTGAVADLDRAVLLLREAVASVPPGGVDAPWLLAGLGRTLRNRFAVTARPEDLEEAVALLRTAGQAVDTGSVDYPMILSNLGSALLVRHSMSKHEADVEEAVPALRRAVEVTPAGHPNRHVRLSRLGAALVTRYDLRAEDSDLDEAITCLREEAADGRPGLDYGNLAAALYRRFVRSGDAGDLDESIRLFEAALARSTADDPHRGHRRSSLATALRSRHAIRGEDADLRRAVELLRNDSVLTRTPSTEKRRGPTVAQDIELTVESTSELAALELQNGVDERSPGHPIAVHREEPGLTPGTVGDPGLISVVLSFASDAIPAVATVLAAWITTRRQGVTRARKVVVTKQGTVIAEIEMAKLENASGDELTRMIDDLLRDDGGEAPEV